MAGDLHVVSTLRLTISTLSSGKTTYHAGDSFLTSELSQQTSCNLLQPLARI